LYACDEDEDEDTNQQEHGQLPLAAVGITDTTDVRDTPGVAEGVEKETRNERRKRERRTRRENEKREEGADAVVRPADAVADESI
jgi:hypothetical protein